MARQDDLTAATLPRVGMFATVRNRRGVVAGVEPYDGPSGRQHLVHIEYKDDGYPVEEQLLWELEPCGRLLPPAALPDVLSTPPMPADDFDALVRAALDIVSASLDANAGEHERALAALRRRKDGLEHRITAHELTQQRQAERDERHQQRLASGEDDPGRRTSNPRPPRRVTLGRPPNA
jgi:hypothetical protein